MLIRFIIASIASLALSVPVFSREAPPLPEARQPEPIAMKLSYQFKVGQFVHYETESETSMTVVAKEVKQTTRESRQTKQHYRVVSVSDDGSAVLEPVIDEAVMEARSDDNKPVRFDSRDEATPPKAFLAVRDSIGRPSVRLRCKPNGSAIEVLPINGIDKRLPTDASQHTFLTVLPDALVKVGDVWHDDFSAPVTMQLSEKRTIKKDIPIRRRYTLTKLEGHIATIEFRTYPLEVVREPNLQAQLIQRSLTGYVKFDVQAGLQIEVRSSGSNIVHGALGASSSMQASASNWERYVASPQPRGRKPAAQIGPELPGPAKLSAATK